MVEIESDSCRICLSITQANDRDLLFSDDDSLSDVGYLYEEVLCLLIGEEVRILRYICNSCTLQLKLFKDFKTKALETHLLLSDIHDLSDEYLNKNSSMTDEYSEDNKDEMVEEANEYDCIETTNESITIKEENIEELDELEIQYLDEEAIFEDVDEVQDEEYLLETEESKSVNSSLNGKSEQSDVHACSDCEETFKLKTHLMNHKRRVHPKIKRYTCTLCPKMMYSEEALEVHLNLHYGLPAYQCNICEKTFKQKAHYNYHMLNHRNERNVICEECNKGFISKSDLKIHMRVHTDERRYSCDICEKTFRAHTHMINHRYSHFEKQFECPACFQKYVSPNTLRTHFKAVHMGEVPFECEFCEKKFKRKHHLHAHYKTHNKVTETVSIPNVD